MRHIAYSKIVEAVKELCVKSAYELPADVLSALTAAAKKESNTLAAKILRGWIGAEAARDIHRCHFLAMRGSGRPQVDEDHRHLPLDARFPLGICQPK